MYATGMHQSRAYPKRPPAAGAVTRWLVPIPVIIRMRPGPKWPIRPLGVISGISKSENASSALGRVSGEPLGSDAMVFG